jgi:LacI family transcriptional regulator
MTATIRDIAKAAGVGVGTVSRVLNKTGYVSEETQQRIWDVIQRFHYVPNGSARALATKRTMVLGALLHDLTNPFVSHLALGIQEEARRAGYTMMLLDTNWQDIVQDIAILRQQPMDGVLLISPAYASVDVMLDSLREIGMPVVVIDRGDGEERSHITIDHYKGAIEAMRWAQAQGHSRIGFLAGPREVRYADLRLRAYLDAMQWHKLALADLDQHPEVPVARGNFTFEGGYQATEMLLQNHPGITCIFAANDLSALGAMRYLGQQKIAIPERVAVIGFDDILTASLVHPALTTVHQPIHEMGAAGARLLIDCIKQTITFSSEREMFEVSLVVRESC